MNSKAHESLLPIAQNIYRLSQKTWPDRPVIIIGQSPALEKCLAKAESFAPFREPILILGESGTGKELFSKACHLLRKPMGGEFVPVNCPQYTDTNTTISELFGHKKGSFTGAVSDRQGLIERAEGGTLFLDEIADLPMSAQIMLLRTLADGFRRMGESTLRQTTARVLAATNRRLDKLVTEQAFRSDLLFRLGFFPIRLPPLRERGQDWFLIAQHLLAQRAQRYGVTKELSQQAISRLRSYDWPGNARRLEAVIALGYAQADGPFIEPRHFEDALALQLEESPMNKEDETRKSSAANDLYQRVIQPNGGFWKEVRKPFLDRSLNRDQVLAVMERGLLEAGSYTNLLPLFHIPSDEYQKFMDFLRHHQLKPPLMA